MRGLLLLLVSICALLAATSCNPEPPLRGTLDDLRSDAAFVLNQCDGVFRVERLVPVDRPTHRIVQIADAHFVPYEDFEEDCLDQDPNATETEIREAYLEVLRTVARVQISQRKLLRWLAKYEGMNVVHLEGITDSNLEAYRALVRAYGKRGVDRVPMELGATAKSLVSGELLGVLAAEDSATYEAADPFVGESVTFAGPANDRRERAIVERLVASGPLSVVILGNAHDLSQHVRKIGATEYLRVFVDGFPGERERARRSLAEKFPELFD